MTTPALAERPRYVLPALATARIKALDLFAGTGWGVACRRLGIKEAGVELMDEAVATRTANGMETIYRDVWDGLQLTAERHRELYGSYGLLIASPPCQTFSLAGKGAGRAALDQVLEAIELHAYKDADALLAFGHLHDMRTALVLTPLAYVWRDRPKLVAFEQVPTVLPVWEACAEVMREWGYQVKVEVLNAEQYGVPQTRKRAILVARRGGPVDMPTPTHSRYYSHNPGKLDPGVKKWVSMAEALGWAPDPSAPNSLRSNYGTGGDASNRGERTADQPAPTLTSKADRNKWDGARNMTASEAAALQAFPGWVYDRPSPTIVGTRRSEGGMLIGRQLDDDSRRDTGGHQTSKGLRPGMLPGVRVSGEQAAALQSYPTGAAKNMGRGMVERHGERPGRPATAPAFTVRASAGGTEPGGFVFMNEDGATRKTTASEAAALQSYPTGAGWGFTGRPAVTVGNAVGRGLIGGSGAKDAVVRAIDGGTFIPSPHGDGSDYANQTRITVPEAGVLQTYEPPFVFCGTKTKQFLQIGNAVPPLLAEHILAALVGIPVASTRTHENEAVFA